MKAEKDYEAREVTIRSAREKDFNHIISLLTVLYKDDIGQGLKDIVREYVSFSTHCVLIAIAGNQVVGILIGSYRLDIDYECRAGFIDAIIVDEKMRNHGIGKKLMKQFSEWAQIKQCTVMQVLNGNRLFFEPLGFKERPAVFHQVPIREKRGQVV